MAKKKALSYAALRKRQLKEAAAVADRIRPLLEKDPRWALATDDVAFDKVDHRLYKKAVTAITKKAVQALHPGVAVSVARGRGTAHGWIYVTMKAPAGDLNRRELRACTEDVLLALGIRYSTYLPDCMPGRDQPTPCLSFRY